MTFDSIIFDLDGTLWDSTEGICATWNMILANYPEMNRVITCEELHQCMGLPMDEIGRRLFPDVTDEMRSHLMEQCCLLENEYLAEHGGILYPNLEETLKKLSEKYKLYIVSNCQSGYIESFLKAHDMAKYFLDFESFGATGLTKGENNRLVIERNQLKSPIYVGDTQGDAQSAIDAGIPFVFATYGFGAVTAFDASIDSFDEMLTLTL